MLEIEDVNKHVSGYAPQVELQGEFFEGVP